jgi:hypothetical protein
MPLQKKRKRSRVKLVVAAFAIGVTIAIGVMTQHSEFVQRLTGNREDRRVERTAVTPRFEFASATLQISVGEIYNVAGDAVDLTASRDVSLDRQSNMAKSEVKIERTSTEIAPGVNAVPFDALTTSFTEVMTKSGRYESPFEPGGPWTKYTVQPSYYDTPIDAHFIPMIDDIVGYQLRDLPTKPPVTPSASGLRSSLLPKTRPAVSGLTPPTSVSSSFSYQIDLATFRRAVPILANRIGMYGPPLTPVTLTLGFDDVGLLRYADVGMASSVASTLAQQLGTKHSAIYHYSMSVSVISGEPISIDVPTDVVDSADAASGDLP